jgi:acyl carrier protein
MLNSLGSVLGGNSFINIATVSNYIKSYITKQARVDKQSWQVQCWDSWHIEWGQIGKFFPEVMYKRVEPSILTNEEGILSFERTFAVQNIIELAISGTDLSSRYNRWVKLESLQKQKDEQREVQLMPRPEMAIAYAEPKSQTEYTLQGVFSELLGIEKVGTNDDFFELGGHSLLGVQLSSKVRNIFSIDMDLYQLIGNPTIATLAAYVESLEKLKKRG